MTTAFVALGSNEGKRQTALRSALARLAQIPRTQVAAVATFRETEPVDCLPGMGAFINSAVKIETGLGAVELLARLMRIEQELGRVRTTESVRQARTMDLDLIFFGEEILTLPELVIPHPRMHQRIFVLEPLVEIAPDFRHPVLGKSLRELLHAARERAALERMAG